MNERRRTCGSCAVVFFFLAAGCSKQNNIDQSESSIFQQTIDPNTDGTFGGPEGMRITIPRGAVTATTTIEMSIADPGAYPALPSGYQAAGQVYAFEPTGQRFEKPVLIDLPFDSTSSANGALTAEPGGSWAPAVSARSGLFVEVQTDHFSFYVPTSMGGGPINGDDAGKTSYPDASTGGSGGDGGGGNINPGGMCATGEPAAGPQGTTDATGSLGRMYVPSGLPFTALDGYATVQRDVMTGGIGSTYTTRLNLVFTDYSNACGYALATNQTARGGGGGMGGKASSRYVEVGEYQWSSNTGPVDPMPGTYNNMPAMFVGLDAMCTGQQAHDMPPSVTITAVDATHVAGTISLNDMSGDTFTGNFDFPICNLPTMPGAATCCMK
jgi:hypothetical protein